MSRSLLPSLLAALARVLRACSWVLVALVVADAVLPAGPRSLLLPVNSLISRLIPAPMSGLFVFQTPFEGAFRGDFAIVAIVLLVLDWICCRVSASLR